MRAWKGLVAAAVGCLVLASSTCYAGTIYACKKTVGGTIRIVGATTTCLATEKKMSWPNAAEVAALKTQAAAQATTIADLQTKVTALTTLLEHFSRNGNDISITGANLWIKSGSGSTSGWDNDLLLPTVNGLGNLIVGYNEARGDGSDNRTGSHNIVVGWANNYSSYGGLVAGERNTISGAFATVSGGNGNTASGSQSSVGGGYQRTAAGGFDWVAGGLFQTD